MIDIEPIKILYVAIILVAAWLLGRLIRRGRLNLIKEAAIGKLLFCRFETTGIYLAAIMLSLWLLDIHTLWPTIEASYPLPAKIFQVILIWAVAIYIVRTFKDVFDKVKEAAKARNKGVSREVNVLVKKFFKYIVYAVALVWTLTILGVTGAIEGMLVGAGFAGIVIGFAAQQTLSNMLAGIAIILDRPFKIGDWIHLKGSNLVGRVDEISLRSTTITAPDNTPINLPNSMLDKEAVVNYTSNPQRRFFIPVSISYESDIAKAMKIIKDTLEKDPASAKEKQGRGYFSPLEIVVEKMGESSIDLKAKIFVNTTEGGGIFETESRMIKNIKENLTKAGIEIPYPRRYVIMDKEGKKK